MALMDQPQVLNSLTPRGHDDVAAMAVAIQANLVSLKVAWSKRVGIPSDRHEIRTPPPGPVRHFREVLIDRGTINAYADGELALRTRQVWGEFGALCWVLGHDDPHRPPDFAHLPPHHATRCPAHVQAKLDEVQTGLWRIRFEQRHRLDPAARREAGFQRDYQHAMATPMLVYGQNVRVCSNDDLLLCACEHAGMLAALRWAIDDRLAWEQAGIMRLDLPEP